MPATQVLASFLYNSKYCRIVHGSELVLIIIMTLPSSIEAHLAEAGFTQTELCILRYLLDGEPRSLRDIGAKSKKSTGVLDQAMRKLVRRKIVTREKVNGVYKFSLQSLDAVLKWIEDDEKNKQKLLKRRKQDFQSFANALKKDGLRPKMEYFEGEEGIAKAYEQMLTCECEELIQFLPLDYKEEDDPIGKIRMEFNRKRKMKNLSMRVLTHDTQLGKRFRERDDFCFRTTKLVDESRCPISFEKIICGDTIACFNHLEKSAYFIHYPELAEGEMMQFNILWNEGEVTTNKNEIKEKLNWMQTLKPLVLVFIITLFISSTVTYSLYQHQYAVNTQRVRERIRAVAANAVTEFDDLSIDNLKTWKDVNLPEYKDVIGKLEKIKERNSDVVYAYIMRPTNDPYFYEFIADAESLDIWSREDLNEDGIVNDMIAPGHVFYDEDPLTSAIWKAYSLGVSAADPGPTHDPWGTWIAGHAPIFDNQNNVIGILGVDADATEVFRLTIKDFSPLLYFFAIYLLLILFQYRGIIDRVKSNIAKLSFCGNIVIRNRSNL